MRQCRRKRNVAVAVFSGRIVGKVNFRDGDESFVTDQDAAHRPMAGIGTSP